MNKGYLLQRVSGLRPKAGRSEFLGGSEVQATKCRGTLFWFLWLEADHFWRETLPLKKTGVDEYGPHI